MLDYMKLDKDVYIILLLQLLIAPFLRHIERLYKPASCETTTDPELLAKVKTLSPYVLTLMSEEWFTVA